MTIKTVDNGGLTDYDVEFGAGVVTADTQRVVTASDSPEVAALEVMDDWDEGDRAKVNLIVGQAGVAAGAGTSGATVLRTVEATDSQLSAGIGSNADAAAAVGAAATVNAKLRLMTSQLDAVATAAAAAIPAGENHVGEIGGNTAVVAVTFSLDTAAHADGDVLADTQVLAACLRVNDGTAILQSIVLNDKDDQGQALDVVIFDANVALGTENAAVSISDANADNILAIIPVTAEDWVDLGGCRVATIRNLSIPVRGAGGTDDLYVGLVSRGTGTYTASGITARFGFLRD